MDRLENQGLVYRERSPEDRRVIQAKLTEAGHAKISDVFQGHVEHIEHLARHLDVDAQDLLRSHLKTLGVGLQENDLA